MKHFAQLTIVSVNGQAVESPAYQVTDEQAEYLKGLVSKLSQTFDMALTVQVAQDNSLLNPDNRPAAPTEEAPVAEEAPAEAVAEAPVEASDEIPVEGAPMPEEVKQASLVTPEVKEEKTALEQIEETIREAEDESIAEKVVKKRKKAAAE